MSKIKLTGSNSGYVEIDSAADAGNLTLQLPTSGTKLLSDATNVFTGITTTGQLDINGSIDVSSTSVFNNDLTLKGGSYDVLWDSSDNALEFGTNAKATFGGAMQLYHDGSNSLIQDSGTGHVQIRSGTFTVGNAGLTKTSAIFNSGSGQQLNFNNNQKFITTNTGVVVSGICTATSFSGSGEELTRTTQLSHRNIIVNGAMQVAQRGTSTTSSSGVGTVDRVIFYYGGIAQHIPQAQVDVSSGTTPYTLGFRKSFRVTNANQGTAGSDDTVVILYRIEAQDLAQSGWNYTSSSSYVTLSYWVKSSVAQNFYVTLKSGDGTPQKYATETGSLTANTWTKVTKTIPGNSNISFDNDNGEGLEIEWSLYRGTDQTGSMSLNAWAANNNSVRTPDQPTSWFQTNGATFELTGIQLEVGEQATPFEHRSFSDELTRCSRYLQIFHVPSNDSYRASNITATVHGTGGGVYLNVAFTHPMRVAPSITVDGAFGGNVFTGSWSGATLSSITAEYSTDALTTLGFNGITSASVTGSHTTGLTGQIYTANNGSNDAALIYSAEL